MARQESWFIKPSEITNKLYQRSREYKKFEGITEERFNYIKNSVEHYKSYAMPTRKFDSTLSLNFEWYLKCIRMVTSFPPHVDFKSYDEKILFLILAVDPDLSIYMNYIDTYILPKSSVESVSDEETRNKLNKIRDGQVALFKGKVRKDLGFYEAILVGYEATFFKQFKSKDQLVTNVQAGFIGNLFANSSKVSSFDSVSQDKFDEINESVKNWVANFDPKNTNLLSFHLCNQSELLKVSSLEEKLVFFILANDPDLDILRIYEEESMVPKAKNRCVLEKGYYIPDIIRIEKLFHQKFCPDKVVSVWSK